MIHAILGIQVGTGWYCEVMVTGIGFERVSFGQGVIIFGAVLSTKFAKDNVTAVNIASDGWRCIVPGVWRIKLGSRAL